MKKAIIVEIICFLFIFLFIYAAASKLMRYEQFVLDIMQSPFLNGYQNTLAWLVPAIELVIAGMLIKPRFRQAGLYASFNLMLLFSGYVIAIQLFAENIPCSCGGLLSKMGWTEHMIFNIAFMFLGLVGIILSSSNHNQSIITPPGELIHENPLGS